MLPCWAFVAVFVPVALVGYASAILQVGQAAPHGKRSRVQVLQETGPLVRIWAEKLRACRSGDVSGALCCLLRVLRAIRGLRGA